MQYLSADGAIRQTLQADSQELIQAGPAQLALDANHQPHLLSGQAALQGTDQLL